MFFDWLAGYTLKQIATEYNSSSERVRQIVAKEKEVFCFSRWKNPSKDVLFQEREMMEEEHKLNKKLRNIK